jgi:hypothetical protein
VDRSEVYPLAVAVGLAAVHLTASRLRFLEGTPRSVWLSGAGGVSVAYVFVHILPDLAGEQEHFRNGEARWLAAIERHVWILALCGLVTFYGIERFIRAHSSGDSKEVPAGTFWLHICSFALYNLLFGYLLTRRDEPGVTPLMLYAAAIGLHFLVTDFGLRMDHAGRYDSVARWVLSASVVAGCIFGLLVPVSRLSLAALFSYLAGGIVLNVLKEELPQERESRFSAFAAGAAFYAVVLLSV